jgi:hypothetical protein
MLSQSTNSTPELWQEGLLTVVSFMLAWQSLSPVTIMR